MQQRKLEARTRPFDRAQQGDENGPTPMSIAVKLRAREEMLPVVYCQGRPTAARKPADCDRKMTSLSDGVGQLERRKEGCYGNMKIS